VGSLACSGLFEANHATVPHQDHPSTWRVRGQTDGMFTLIKLFIISRNQDLIVLCPGVAWLGGRPSEGPIAPLDSSVRCALVPSPRTGAPYLARFSRDARISCTRHRATATCAAFIEESRMKFTSANTLHRKSGGVGFHCFFPLTLNSSETLSGLTRSKNLCP
jgi:hypothetical protein